MQKCATLAPKSPTGAREANEQLQDGYQRLWNLGELRESEEIRKRLFRFVVCAFAPLKLSTVAHALRIGIEDGENPYRKDFSIKNIDKLCSNFLSKDDSGHLSWTHDSARDFVVRRIVNPGIDLSKPNAEVTSMKSNHLLVANTFIAVMKDSDHPVWKEVDLDPSEWKPPKRNSSMKIRGAQGCIYYLSRYGCRHCQHAADKKVIFDPLWTRVLRELILRHKTAFALWWRVWFDPWSFQYGHLEEVLGDYAGERTILISHTLAFLDLKTAPPEGNTEKDLVESLVRHAACKSLSGANVLHLACSARNGSILKFMIQAIIDHHGEIARVFELLEEIYEDQTPFTLAFLITNFGSFWSQHRFDVMKILLEFEKKCSRPNGCDQSSNRAPSLCLWSHKPMNYGEPIVLLSVIHLLCEDDVISLLDIHKPCDINVQTEDRKETALHCAARLGRFQLVKVLVEECHAAVDVPDSQGETPVDVARNELEFELEVKCPPKQVIERMLEVVKYLGSINQSDPGDFQRLQQRCSTYIES